MSENPSHVQGYRETKAAKAAERYDQADEVWTEVEAERQAFDERRTAKLRAMQLARVSQNLK
ncbi:hypothetical protein ABS771_18690 [Methylobacterium brachiatum]|uniref:Uncharacterized protein n=1 Tax=Methylobacterium brachiatum TaxID=269660 RepID=A0ABV1R589_9HYPH